ncbi:probable ubiquitin conjugation factor E4 [Papaver somniferum]|uniref:probable ubiquitin conjugation factor E4 n=1 Tax=Papaver somniferum TaxID=3469 RepID=UPI000E7053D9|nr:probable ubiquitin conjugation factor E4 [Papaver somniferum]
MATGKPKRSPEVIEDILIQRIFLVTLTNTDNKQVMYLEKMAVENLREGKSLLLNRDLMDEVLVGKLSGQFSGKSLFQYLTGCYGRAFEEGKKISNMKDVDLQSSLLNGVIKPAKKLLARYCQIDLCNPDMFPHSEKISAGSALLQIIFSAVSQNSNACGNEFLNEFFTETDDYEIMAPIFKDLYDRLKHEISKVNDSPLGNFVPPLKVFRMLVRFPNGGKALVNHPLWLPKGEAVNGRVIEEESILGSFFHISHLTDVMISGQPDFELLDSSNSSASHLFELSSANLPAIMCNLYDGLEDILLCLLNSKDTRERVLEYMGDVIERNSSRAHMNIDKVTCASSGMFVNLSVVMLRLSDPILNCLAKRDKIDARYVSIGTRLNLRRLTTLHATEEEIGAWADENKYGKSQYGFICECFFMTARVLNLGLLKGISECKSLTKDLSTFKRVLTEVEAQPTTPYSLEEIARLNRLIGLQSNEKSSYEFQLDNNLQQALSFYRLMIVRLVDSVGGFKMPLPRSCPVEFGCMPEHFVDDAMELLIFSSEVIPKKLDPYLLNDFMNFIIMFIASPNYITNPYLRAKMLKLLNCWTIKRNDSATAGSPYQGHQLALASPFQGHKLALGQYLVGSLLKLYVDIEFTQFLEKFFIRNQITQLLKYVWEEPSHLDAWKKFAKEEEKGVYLNFLNFLINDSIYLQDEGLNKIRKLKEMDKQRKMVKEREDRTDESHSEVEEEPHSESQSDVERDIREYIALALDNINMLAFTSEQITAPFLLPQMVERIANMLNYFLVQLVGPKRNSLSLKNAEKYGFEPRILLRKIISIYVHIARDDKENTFAAAICKDGRSYSDKLFTEVAKVRGLGEDGNWMELQEFANLGAKVRLVASEAMDAEAALGEIPDEFLDPIQCTLMTDPVTLPSSNVTVERSVIERHLLSDTKDPFNRSHLTQDMLIPDVQLKSRIDEFVRSRIQHTS